MRLAQKAPTGDSIQILVFRQVVVVKLHYPIIAPLLTEATGMETWIFSLPSAIAEKVAVGCRRIRCIISGREKEGVLSMRELYSTTTEPQS